MRTVFGIILFFLGCWVFHTIGTIQGASEVEAQRPTPPPHPNDTINFRREKPHGVGM